MLLLFCCKWSSALPSWLFFFGLVFVFYFLLPTLVNIFDIFYQPISFLNRQIYYLTTFTDLLEFPNLRVVSRQDPYSLLPSTSVTKSGSSSLAANQIKSSSAPLVTVSCSIDSTFHDTGGNHSRSLPPQYSTMRCIHWPFSGRFL